ncbi:MAG: cyclic nucleotide-binding domain-containing protein [Alphaproteobacteria bacterium]
MPAATTEKTEKIQVSAGQRLFHEGEPGDRAYLVMSGRIEISKKTRDDEVILAMVGRGEIVGEMALIDDMPRMATARAVEPTTLVIVTRESFRRKVEALDPVSAHLFTKFVRIIRDQANELAQLRKVVR